MIARRLLADCPGLWRSHRGFRDSIVLLPVGSFEDHGDLPPALDTLLALETSCIASKQCGVAVAWPLGYGFSPEHGWSVSLDEDEAARLVGRIYEGMMKRARRVVVVDGHYGHREALRRVVEGYVNVWDLLIEEGFRGFEEQLVFEKMFAEGRARDVLARVARRLCMLAKA